MNKESITIIAKGLINLMRIRLFGKRFFIAWGQEDNE